MVGKKNQSALLSKYYGMYKKNPRSRVFAPLAEAYRKLGMYDEAYKILRDGIRNHPNYTLGYIVLAHCYFDQEKYELTYNTLRPIISKNADNISLQKVFAESCIQLGHLEEALDTFKYLLFMNPKDKYFAEQVKKLEDDLMVGHKKLSLEQIIQSPEQGVPIDYNFPKREDDDWVQVDFTSKDIKEEEDSNWVMQRSDLSDHPILKDESIKERSLEDDFYADEFEDEHGNIEDVNAGAVSSDAPIVSHTLIDLYCSQHYYDKAIELLEKILELNPGDGISKRKLESVLKLKEKHAGEFSEEDGHNELTNLIETKVKAGSPKEKKIKKAFDSFLEQLKDRAQELR